MSSNTPNYQFINPKTFCWGNCGRDPPENTLLFENFSITQLKPIKMTKINFDKRITDIESFPDEKIGNLAVPVESFIQEGSDLYIWCLEDEEPLIRAGLDWSLVEDVPDRVGALQYAESVWKKEYKAYTDSLREWKKVAPEAYDLRDYLLHYFYHAFRDMPDLITKLHAIDEGTSYVDMIQDLSDLVVIGRDHTEELTSAGLDLALIDNAEEMAGSLNEMLANVNKAKAKASPNKLIRDKAYFFLKEAVDEIRHHGQFAFWRDENRKLGYGSAYARKKYNKRKLKQVDKAEDKIQEEME